MAHMFIYLLWQVSFWFKFFIWVYEPFWVNFCISYEMNVQLFSSTNKYTITVNSCSLKRSSLLFWMPCKVFQRSVDWSCLSFRMPWNTIPLLCGCMPSCPVMPNSFATPWTVDWPAPLSIGFSRQEYWSGLPFPPLLLGLNFKKFPHHSYYYNFILSWNTLRKPLDQWRNQRENHKILWDKQK